jgi:hypothetical protein
MGVELSGQNGPMAILPVTITPELAAEGRSSDALGGARITRLLSGSPAARLFWREVR